VKYNIELAQEAVSDVNELFYADKKLLARILKKLNLLPSIPVKEKL